MNHILVIDDEKRIRDLMALYLKKEGYDVTEFDNGNDAEIFLQTNDVDLIVLDIMMQGINGLDLCKKIRFKSNVPIIFVSARSDEVDRILGLELGADDYLPKPFSPRELVARVKNILKRIERPHKKIFDNILQIADVTLFIEQRVIKIRDTEFSFTAKEFEVLKFLIENKGYPLSREKIIQKVWGYEYDGYDRNVDDTIKRLRKKLKEGNSEVKIQTVWGYGYKVSDDE